MKDPWRDDGGEDCLRYYRDGALVAGSDGSIVDHGSAATILPRYPNAPVIVHEGCLILPGLIDLHLHYPQLDLIGHPAPDLLTWLTRHTLPHERRFANPAVARDGAEAFCHELLAYGTTTALIFSSSHASATLTLAACMAERGLRGIVGKCSMDRHVPPDLVTPAASEAGAIAELLQSWPRSPLVDFALTPRYAPACSEELLAILGALAADHPKAYIQTHHAESLGEVAWIGELYPKDADYLAVYERFGLIRRRSILAHVIHASPSELDRLAKREAGIAHCPTSNLFLGSGLFKFKKAAERGIVVGLGTDVGGGTSFSLWQTMNEAYKVSMLLGEALTPSQLLHAATRGAARALDRDDLGNFDKGRRADFLVIDPSRHRLLRRRNILDASPEEIMFALIHHADDRIIIRTYVEHRLVSAIDS